MLVTIAQLLVSGLAFGAVYALLALSYSLIYRSTRTINFAQGYLAMVGAYVALWAISDAGLPYSVAAIIGIAAVVVLSVIVEVFAFRPLYRFGAVIVIVSSIALTFVLETLLQLGWGAQSVRLPSAIRGTISVGAVVVSWQQILVVTGLALSATLLHILMLSRLGRAMRATAESIDVAGLVGIRARTMITASFGLAGALTGAAGILVAPLTYLEPNSGGSLGLMGVIAAIVGGLGKLSGAVAGGLVIGLVNIFGSYFLGGSLVETATFLVLVLMLLLRPEGLFGEEGTKVRA